MNDNARSRLFKELYRLKQTPAWKVPDEDSGIPQTLFGLPVYVCDDLNDLPEVQDEKLRN